MSEFDAFSGGVLPGGLRTQNDVRILVCYLLQSAGAPLSEADITKIVQENGLANYFEVKDAISALLKLGRIRKNDEALLEICESGLQIAEQLDVTLPLSVRDKALKAAVQLLARAKRERENRVDIEKTSTGYQVHCHISGGTMDLMTISIYVPNKKQANFVKNHFHEDPGAIYTLLLSALTGDLNMQDQA